MGIVMWLIAGLIVGAAAKLFVPGKDPGGLLATLALGIAGAFAGGVVSSLLGMSGLSGPNVASFAIATLGAMALLGIMRLLKART